MPDSQQYHLNLYLSDKAENIVVFILKEFNSFYFSCSQHKSACHLIEKIQLKIIF